MKILASLVKETIPYYLTNLPVPDTFGGWFHLGLRDWLSLIPPTVIVGGLGYLAYQAIMQSRRSTSCCIINTKIRKRSAKVVDFIDIEDIPEQIAFCRCWLSSTWPYCDGSHNEHNDEFDDNVGPLIIKRKIRHPSEK